MANPVDDAGNVRVDHVWGNMPMQPDDARGENTLDPALDNHIIATSGWNGFPAYIPGEAVYQDTVANVTVPNVVGLSDSAAITAIQAAGLTAGAVFSDNEDGATSENDGTVKSQTPAAGTVVNEDTEVVINVYDYTAVAQALTLTLGTDYAPGEVWGGGHPGNQDGLVYLQNVTTPFTDVVPNNSTWTVEVTYGATTLTTYPAVQAPWGGIYLEPTGSMSSDFTTALPSSSYSVTEITFDPATSTASVTVVDAA